MSLVLRYAEGFDRPFPLEELADQVLSDPHHWRWVPYPECRDSCMADEAGFFTRVDPIYKTPPRPHFYLRRSLQADLLLAAFEHAQTL